MLQSKPSAGRQAVPDQVARTRLSYSVRKTCESSRPSVACRYKWNRSSSSSSGGGQSESGSGAAAASRFWRSEGSPSNGYSSSSSSPYSYRPPEDSSTTSSSPYSSSTPAESSSPAEESSSIFAGLAQQVAAAWGRLTGALGGSGSSSSSSGSRNWADAASPWILVAFVPVVVWCITWSFTTGMACLADACLTGLSSVAQLLYPTLPLRGVTYEDVAIALVKTIQSSTDDAATWSRPGVGWPGWLVRFSMCSFYGLAVASTSLSSSFRSIPAVLAAGGFSMVLVYALCLLLMLPVGRGLQSLVQRVLPKAPWPKLKPQNALSLKLLGVLCWPCISAAAVARGLHHPAAAAAAASSLAAPGFPATALQAAVSLGTVVVLLTAAGCALRFGYGVLHAEADVAGVMDWGLQVGAICGLQLLLNMLQFGLSMAYGAVRPDTAVPALLSMFILARLAWSLWQLSKHQEPVLVQAWMDVLDSSVLPKKQEEAKE